VDQEGECRPHVPQHVVVPADDRTAAGLAADVPVRRDRDADGELGHAAGDLHRKVGRYAAAQGVDLLIGVRGNAHEMVNAAVGAGLPESAAYFFDDPEQAGDFVRLWARPGDAILFKGSRGVQVERALRRFQA